jgi:hypothetical protein
MEALESRCADGETIVGVCDGSRLMLADMVQRSGAIVLTDARLVFVDMATGEPDALTVPIEAIKELGERRGFLEVVLAPGPPNDGNTLWLRVGPGDEAPRLFASLIMSNGRWTGG